MSSTIPGSVTRWRWEWSSSWPAASSSTRSSNVAPRGGWDDDLHRPGPGRRGGPGTWRTDQEASTLRVADLYLRGHLLPGPPWRHLLLVAAGGKGCPRLRGLPAFIRGLQILAVVHRVGGQRRRRDHPQPAHHRANR